MSQEIRLKHLQLLESAGVDPYPAQVPPITHTCCDVVNARDLEGTQVQVAGRIKAVRDHGKAVFYDIEDEVGRLQLIWDKQAVGASHFDLVKETYDTGDIVSAKGTVIRTRKHNQVTVQAQELTMLSKALREPPQGHTGIIDPEVARGQRHLELMANIHARTRFRMRERMIQIMREEFLERGFLEVETPVLDIIYGGAFSRPFTTRMHALDQDMYLRIANELYLKRLVCGGMGSVFEFSRNFRNEGMDRTHNPEFTLVELYRPYSDYTWMMEMAEDVLENVAKDIHGKTMLTFGKHEIDFKAPWRRLTVYDGLRQAFQIEPSEIGSKDLGRLAVSEGLDTRFERRGDILLALFEKKFGEDLIQPTFVMDYPQETSPLAKQHRCNPDLVERFEGIVGGMKVMNCYTELNDPRDQRMRFELEKERRKGGYARAMPTDEDFLRAMEYGFPPMSGIGISIDRMAMLITNTSHIRDIILFPPVKERNGFKM